jgi:hypothetical protein
MRDAHSEGLNLMNAPVISEKSFEAGWVGRPEAMDGCASVVKAYGDRLYSIAKRITQNDDDTESVLIETFLEVCSDLDAYPQLQDARVANIGRHC